MSKRTTESIVKSSPEWGELEGWLRGSMQKLIQEVLEEEVTEFLGRAKSERRSECGQRLAVTVTGTAGRGS